MWLRRVREKLAAEDAKGPTSRVVRERERQVDEIIARLGLKRISADAARARPRRVPRQRGEAKRGAWAAREARRATSQPSSRA
jgi:hypothetical protein